MFAYLLADQLFNSDDDVAPKSWEIAQMLF